MIWAILVFLILVVIALGGFAINYEKKHQSDSGLTQEQIDRYKSGV